jgi:hypothetical protein
LSGGRASYQHCADEDDEGKNRAPIIGAVLMDVDGHKDSPDSAYVMIQNLFRRQQRLHIPILGGVVSKITRFRVLWQHQIPAKTRWQGMPLGSILLAPCCLSDGSGTSPQQNHPPRLPSQIAVKAVSCSQ